MRLYQELIYIVFLFILFCFGLFCFLGQRTLLAVAGMYHVHQREDEGDATGHSDVEAHVVVEGCPVDVRGAEFLEEQQAECA